METRPYGFGTPSVKDAIFDLILATSLIEGGF